MGAGWGRSEASTCSDTARGRGVRAPRRSHSWTEGPGRPEQPGLRGGGAAAGSTHALPAPKPRPRSPTPAPRSRPRGRAGVTVQPAGSGSSRAGPAGHAQCGGAAAAGGGDPAVRTAAASVPRRRTCPRDLTTGAEGGAVLRPVPDAELELSPEEQRVLERKLKKERKKEERQRLREAGLAAQHPPARRSGAELALDYLCAWAQKHKNWRFQKTRQTWLLLHMYDRDKVPDEHFSTMLAYLEGLQGRARELTVQKAEALMRELDEEDPDPLLPGRVQRIRQTLLGRRQL
ncbi:protein cholesin isoform X1 [Macaca nemestrina]|uniref:protein cholesin isoform X1 n=1 Tax=Macaca nemestrina TaxID=9545 RepID=UPI0039B98839